MNRQTYSMILLFLLLVLATKPAQSQKILPISGKILKSHPPVYLKNREFVYAVKLYGKTGEFVKHDTLVFNTYNEMLYPEYGQTKSIWRRKADTMKWTTGITENDTTLWIHPPRHDVYKILELSPFPMISYPLQEGNIWKWDLLVGGYWGSKEWVEWEGSKLFRSTYKLAGKETLSTKFGKLLCYKVLAEGSSDFGKTTLLMYFHEKYGFVKLEYQNINQTSMQIELIDETFLNPVLQVGK